MVLAHHEGDSGPPRFQLDVEGVLAAVPQLPCACAENVDYCRECVMWQNEQEYSAFGTIQMHSPYCDWCKGEGDGRWGGLA